MRFVPVTFLSAAISLSGQMISMDASGVVTIRVTSPLASRVVAGAPYSGEEASENVQTLADGTHITSKTRPVKVFRDSLGRTRTERYVKSLVPRPGVIVDSQTLVEIVDPVAQLRYTLDTVNHVAHRQQLPAALTAKNRQAPRASLSISQAQPKVSDEMKFQFVNEKLGTQNIEGVMAEGTRTTMTIPVDAQGNDRPISTVNESWMSRELGLTMMRKTTDPRYGERIWKVTNIGLRDPPADLFLPPPDYAIVDEVGEFQIIFNSQR